MTMTWITWCNSLQLGLGLLGVVIVAFLLLGGFSVLVITIDKIEGWVKKQTFHRIIDRIGTIIAVTSLLASVLMMAWVFGGVIIATWFKWCKG